MLKPTRLHAGPKRTHSKDQIQRQTPTPTTSATATNNKTAPQLQTQTQTQTLQTSGFKTPSNRRKYSIDENISPRTAVSNKFHNLGLYGNMGPMKSAWTANLIRPDAEVEIPRSTPTTIMTRPADKDEETSMVIEETPEPSVCGTTSGDDDDRGLYSSDEEMQSERQDVAQKIYQFNAGEATRKPKTAGVVDKMSKPVSYKRARFEPAEPSSPDYSPAKRRRTSPSPPPDPDTNIQPASLSSPSPRLSPSSFVETQLHSPRPRSPPPPAAAISHHPATNTALEDDVGDEGDEMDPDIAEFWWQPSEITGRTPDDPDEDDYGVNGIGYQKTKAEAYSISQKKNKQLAEWRTREAREARALRAGGRKSMAGVGAGVATGRVTKSGSRSGSPVAAESGRRSPFSPRKEREERIARAVRFEIG